MKLKVYDDPFKSARIIMDDACSFPLHDSKTTSANLLLLLLDVVDVDDVVRTLSSKEILKLLNIDHMGMINMIIIQTSTIVLTRRF